MNDRDDDSFELEISLTLDEPNPPGGAPIRTAAEPAPGRGSEVSQEAWVVSQRADEIRTGPAIASGDDQPTVGARATNRMGEPLLDPPAGDEPDLSLAIRNVIDGAAEAPGPANSSSAVVAKPNGSPVDPLGSESGVNIDGVRAALHAALKGQHHDACQLPHPEILFLALARVLVATGYSVNEIIDAVVAAMLDDSTE